MDSSNNHDGTSSDSNTFGISPGTLRRRLARAVKAKKENGINRILLLKNPLPNTAFKSSRTDRNPVPAVNGADQPVGQAPETRQEEHGIDNEMPLSEKTASLDLYTEHFGLTARPFTLLPDPEFIYWSPAHQRAFTMLEYGVLTRAPITLITGEVGSGKTTLLHHLLKTMEPGVKVGLVSNAQGSRGELLRWVLMALDQPASTEANYVDLFDAFQKFLIDQYARGHRVVIIFDEAQNLTRESLEELRMFTNINSNKDELLQLILVGQPELRDTICRPNLRQFAQRVASSFHLGPMDVDTVQAYIGHRLHKAGARKNLFNRDACELIYENTGGVPRLVNQLCDLSLVYAFTNSQKTVTLKTVQQVLDDGAFFGAGAFAKPGDKS